MRASWWWIDRWQKSTAYKDMTLAEQGAYRNLLDELWLRDGVLPDDERILAKLCGDALEWPNVRRAVMARFTKAGGGWRNETHDEVAGESSRRAEKQRRYRNGRGNAAGNEGRNVTPSPSPSPDQDQSPEKKTPRGKPRLSIAEEVRGTVLDTPVFVEAMESWESSHGRYKPAGLRAQLHRLGSWGPDRAVAAIRYSLAQGFQGIYEDKGGAQQTNGHRPAPLNTPRPSQAAYVHVGSPEWKKAHGE